MTLPFAGAAWHSFTRRFNVRHRKWGRVFGDRYKAVLVDGGSAHHYGTLLVKGTDPRKVALADLLWRHTPVSQSWLAEKLHLQSAANASQLLRRTAPQVLKNKRSLPAPLREFLKSAPLKCPS